MIPAAKVTEWSGELLCLFLPPSAALILNFFSEEHNPDADDPDAVTVRADQGDLYGAQAELPTIHELLEHPEALPPMILLRPGFYRPFEIPAGARTLSGALCIKATAATEAVACFRVSSFDFAFARSQCLIFLFENIGGECVDV